MSLFSANLPSVSRPCHCYMFWVSEQEPVGVESHFPFANQCEGKECESPARLTNVWLKTSQMFKALKWNHKRNFWDNAAGNAFCFIYLHSESSFFTRAVVYCIVVTQQKQMNHSLRTDHRHHRLAYRDDLLPWLMRLSLVMPEHIN